MTCNKCNNTKYIWSPLICEQCNDRGHSCSKCGGTGKIMVYSICGQCTVLGEIPSLHHRPNNPSSISLHNAVINNQIELVRSLIENGANINAVDSKGRTPLQCVIMDPEEYDDMIELLIFNGAR